MYFFQCDWFLIFNHFHYSSFFFSTPRDQSVWSPLSRYALLTECTAREKPPVMCDSGCHVGWKRPLFEQRPEGGGGGGLSNRARLPVAVPHQWPGTSGSELQHDQLAPLAQAGRDSIIHIILYSIVLVDSQKGTSARLEPLVLLKFANIEFSPKKQEKKVVYKITLIYFFFKKKEMKNRKRFRVEKYFSD